MQLGHLTLALYNAINSLRKLTHLNALAFRLVYEAMKAPRKLMSKEN